MATTTPKAALRADTKKLSLRELNTWNKWLAVLYALQAIVLLVLSKVALFPVQISYLTQNPLATEMAQSPVLVTAARQVLDVNLAYIVAAALFAAALVHAAMATVYRKQYEAGLKRGANSARWVACGVSAGIILVAVAFLSGVADLATLALLFAVPLMVGLLCVATEAYNRAGVPRRVVCAMAGIAGLALVAVLGLYVWGTNVYGYNSIPTFVYWIYASILILFAAFAVVMYRQRKQIGPWKDYLYGERAYLALGFAAKTLIVWQIFAGALRP